MTLVLASASPRRRDLLKDAGVSFEIIESKVNEDVLLSEDPEVMVKRLSLLKAEHVARNNYASWVLGADTTVVLDGEILGKPIDKKDAFRMLSALQNRTHIVWTGFALVNLEKKIKYVEAHKSLVTFVPLTEMEISAYIETGEPLDKAGSYAIQGKGAGLISRVDGSYTNVVGLPISHAMEALVKHGVIPSRICITKT